MEWLEFKPWSAEVTRKLAALASSPGRGSRRADVVSFRSGPRRSAQQWATLIRDWPQDSLWGHWVDAES